MAAALFVLLGFALLGTHGASGAGWTPTTSGESTPASSSPSPWARPTSSSTGLPE
uniref:Basigin (Ok blood group) n=1 Tax=Homo sapiens TaxID=9606 RepID=A0A087X2B5_HUMAN